MTRYVVQRLVLALPTLLAMTLIAFALTTTARGDPALIALQQDGQTPTPAVLAEYRERLGLNAPWPARYARWLSGAVQGDFGRSLLQGRQVATMIAERVGPTLLLGTVAFTVSTATGVLLGLSLGFGALRRFDAAIRALVVVAAAAPSFWLAIGLVVVFGEQLRLVPVAGYGTWQHLVLPVTALAVGPTAATLRLTRAAVRDVLGEDYVRTAYAKGLPDRVIAVQHVMRSAAAPLIALTGVRFGHLLAGSVIIEAIFAWPGLGTVLLTAISGRDLPVISAFILLTGALVILANLVSDIAGALLDPRVRFGGPPW